VIAFEIRVSPRAANGEYSIYAESRNGYRRAIIGGLAVDNFAYPWASFTAFDD
jgi:hypothetical protein